MRLKKLGLIVDLILLDKIHTYKLSRDRLPGDDLELEDLKASIAERMGGAPATPAPANAESAMGGVTLHV